MTYSKITLSVLSIITWMVAIPALALSVTGSATVEATVAAPGINVSASTDVKIQARITRAKEHADQEIRRRIDALNNLNSKIQAMVKISASDKASLAGSVASEISALTALQSKIDADTDITALKADIKSISQGYRIFLLIIPQGRITLAADKIQFVADSMTTFSAKLQTRITEARNAGKDVSKLESDLADMNAKIADANAEASAAVSAVAALSPDNGDKAKASANAKALTEARAKIKVAMQDLRAARKNAKAIVEALLALRASTSATTSVTITPQ